jgi:hypothetical protein
VLKLVNHSKLNAKIEGDLYGHVTSLRIVSLIMNKIFI